MHNILVSLRLMVARAALVFRWPHRKPGLSGLCGTQRKRELIKVAVVVAGLTPLSGCYAFKQIYYQGNLLSTRKPISVLLWDRDTPAELKQSLEKVQDIRAYARRAGLTVGGAYGSYIESPHDAVSYIVQAADPLKLELKEWWFPVIGNVPYLGFFNEGNRDEKAEHLRQQGYDVAETSAGAFSSLGWYDDPVYSPMLRRPLHALAHLFFHELTHRTFWIPNEAKLNEHMAEFVAMTLTEQYLREKGATDQLQLYKAWLGDKKRYAGWVRRMRDELNTLYESELSSRQKRVAKQQVFRRYLGQDFPNFSTKRYAYLKQRPWNNAVVLGASLYLPEVEPFERAYRCGNFQQVGSFLARLEEKFAQEKRPARKVLESLCPGSTLGGKGGV